MNSRTIVAAGLVTVGLAGFSGLPRAAASAEPEAPALTVPWDNRASTDDGDPGGRVRFRADGDVVELCDIEADGHAVGFDIYDETAKKWMYSYQIGGEGRCQIFRASLGGKYNLAEHHSFAVTIWLVKDGETGFDDWDTWLNWN